MSESKYVLTKIYEESVLADSSWVRLEQQLEEEDIASPQETAEFLDTVFDTDSCIDSSAVDGSDSDVEVDEAGEAEAPITVSEFNEIAKTLSYSICSQVGDNVDVLVEVHTSHDLPYVIRVIGGEHISTSSDYKEINETFSIDSASYVDLQYRFSSISAIDLYLDTSADYTVSGSLVVFDKSVSGSIRVQGTVVFDVITVTMNNIDEECKVIAFYEELAASLEVEPPVIDDTIENPEDFCAYDQNFDVNPDDVSCYKIVNYLTKCRCSDTTVDRETVELSTDCGDGQLFCPQNQTSCQKLLGSETYVKAYTDCDETTDDISDPEFYEQKCCYPPDFALPRCSVSKSVYRGGKGIDGGTAKYKSIYGDDTKFVAVGPNGPICGTTTVEQRLGSLDCCELATDVYFDTVNNPSVMSDYDAVVLFILKGLAPFTFMSGQDETCFEDANGNEVQSITQDHHHVSFYSKDICGTIEVHVTDSCGTEDTLYIRALDGQWVTREYRDYKAACYLDCDEGNLDHSCEYAGDPVEGNVPSDSYDTVDYETTTDTGWTRRAMQGTLRLTETAMLSQNLYVPDLVLEAACDGFPLRYEYSTSTRGYPPWNYCLGKPSGMGSQGNGTPIDCSSPGVTDCAWCCNDGMSQEYSYYKDRYGVIVCGSRTVDIGWAVDTRRWEEWVC